MPPPPLQPQSELIVLEGSTSPADWQVNSDLSLTQLAQRAQRQTGEEMGAEMQDRL